MSHQLQSSLLVALFTLPSCAPFAVAPTEGGPPDSGFVDSGSPANGPESLDAGCGAPTAVTSGALDTLRASVVSLHAGWRFHTDPTDQGQTSGWAAEGFDDSAWKPIEAGRTWQAQGYHYNGLAWYRREIMIPADWQGSAVKVVANGIDDEYDLYVNGTLIGHHGERPSRSVWSERTVTRIDGALRPGQLNRIAVRVNDWGGTGGIWRSIELRRAVPLTSYKAFLPQPIADGNPEWIELYWQAWRMAWEKVSFGNPENHLVDAYMDVGFNEQIYQWDSTFMALYARYATRLFPGMATLDNFYQRQRPDGYIQRVYSGTDGHELAQPTVDEPLVNPPLFAWVEWEYYRTTGDASRLQRVLPILERYYEWLRAHLRDPSGKGLYYQTGLGSGMDNTPRGDVGRAGWIDMSLEQALAARHLSRIATQLGRSDRAAYWDQEYGQLANTINTLGWHDGDGFYYDLLQSGRPAGVRHIGAFWAILSGVADDAKTARLVAHLQDPAEFFRPHLFPTLAANDPGYVRAGNYWRGGVWAPTNYMVVRGLAQRGHGEFALKAAENHLRNLALVYASPPTDETLIWPEQRDHDYRTLWECYSPESATPGTRWDNTYYGQQDFVGWTGLGPIAMLIENVLGLDVIGAEHKVVWTLQRTDRHGIENLQVGDAIVDLVAEPGQSSVHVKVTASAPFTLELRRAGKPSVIVDVCAGTRSVDLP